MMQAFNEGPSGKPKIRNEKQNARQSQKLLSSEMNGGIFGSIRESKKPPVNCCKLCHAFEPEKCWRKHLMEFLDSRK